MGRLVQQLYGMLSCLMIDGQCKDAGIVRDGIGRQKMQLYFPAGVNVTSDYI
jgi:hypothetical protein